MEDEKLLYHIALLSPARFLTNSLASEGRYSLLFFFAGTGRCTADKVFSFGPGDILFLAAGQDATFTCDDKSSSAAVICFPPHFYPSLQMDTPLSRWVEEYIPRPGASSWLHLEERPLTECRALFNVLYAEYSARQPGGGTLSEILLRGLLGWLARAYHFGLPTGPGQALPHGTELAEHVKKIIAREFADVLTLEAVAQRCFVTPAYLSGLFRRQTGLTFTRYLNLTRISHACRLLLDTDALAVDIGEASGFSCTPHFNLTFRKITGFTPLEYRRQFKKAPPLEETEY